MNKNPYSSAYQNGNIKQQNRNYFQQNQEQSHSISQSESNYKKQTQSYINNNYGLNLNFQKEPQPQQNSYYPQQQKGFQQMNSGNQNQYQNSNGNPIRSGNQQIQNNNNLYRSQVNSSPQNYVDQMQNNHYSGANDQNLYNNNKNYLMSISQNQQTSISKSASINKSQESEDAQIKRAEGCLFGAFIGDSMGSYLEFNKQQITNELVRQAYQLPGGGIFNLTKGQLTDDGELAIMLAEGLLEAKTNEPNDFMINILKKYHFWVNSNPFDFGSTMQNSWMPMNFTTYKELLQKYQNNELNLLQSIQNNAAKTSVNSQSNGFLMKQQPLGILLWNSPIDVIFQFAELDTKFTHSDQFCLEVSKIYTYILAQLIKRGKQESFKIYCEARKLAWENYFSNQMKETFNYIEMQFQGITEQSLRTGEKFGINQIGFPNFYAIYKAEKQIGWVRIAFSYSLYILIANLTVEQLYQGILSIGGDTDTNLCIAGAVYGAQNGIETFPSFMKNAIENCDPEKNQKQRRAKDFAPRRYRDLAQKLYQKGKTMNQNSPKKNSLQLNQLQVSQGSNYQILKDYYIDYIKNCNIESLVNCKVKKIENCYIKSIQFCQIEEITQSRLERISKSQITNISCSIVQDNQAQFENNGIKIGNSEECKFGISSI
ncbi:ADP-ribosylglycohydrolase (macronuclear) [Tetrahymena thermophila SB210]|uniref:ADP-ribosylglycohydrolase n=1 Tax=Tetrahymena thermophila (strain SB210) TaxID=312017 RepID=Q22CZ4_TETTS|nr:ADP-ribosylglycohydrolase [Tetrahymena thermophila SB210]EAR83125.2 ADP-ribosylglycohydrolase [Tetrahymena thermophila SB210]|eukprot:XP_001030788.2 ADP-ribosylglycohydrolase [Tetrahymena thermophila SB210]